MDKPAIFPLVPEYPTVEVCHSCNGPIFGQGVRRCVKCGAPICNSCYALGDYGKMCKGCRDKTGSVDKDIQRRLDHIAEQCEKTQYWNAISTTNELMMVLLKRFDNVLKGRKG